MGSLEPERLRTDELALNERNDMRIGMANPDGTYSVTLTKNEQVIVTQVLVHVVCGLEWDMPETFHGGMGPDFCEACTALEKLGAFGGRTVDQIRANA
jgi:hypothetical protein